MKNPSVFKVDFRERISGIENILIERYGATVITQDLEIGDYSINDQVIVERKTISDFIQSIIDGRLFRQISEMKHFFRISLLVIEGRGLYGMSTNIHPHTIRGALISIALAWRMPVFFTDNIEETAMFLWLIGNRMSSRCNKSPCLYKTKRPVKLIKRNQLDILQGFPRVGVKLASQLLAHFGTVETVINASKQELMKVRGVGKIKAGKIREIASNGFVNNR